MPPGYAEIGTFAREGAVIGEPAHGEILRDGPVLGMNPLDLTGASQSFQSPDMRADIGLGIRFN